jgi:hypothetical protein
MAHLAKRVVHLAALTFNLALNIKPIKEFSDSAEGPPISKFLLESQWNDWLYSGRMSLSEERHNLTVECQHLPKESHSGIGDIGQEPSFLTYPISPPRGCFIRFVHSDRCHHGGLEDS